MTLLSSSDWAFSDDTGPGTDGTVFDAAKMAALKASIELLIHSTTNPTVTPEDIIDEVVTARGSKASLDARLDVAFNEDGTPKSGAFGGFPTTAELTSQIGGINLVPNPAMDIWHAGLTSAPDGFSLVGAGATIVRAGGPGDPDATSLGSGGSVAKVTRAGTDCALEWTQYVGSIGGVLSVLRGRKVSVGVAVKTSVVNQARVTLSDGVGSTSSSYHTGGGATEWLTVTHTLSGSATDIKLRLEVNNSNGAVYFGGHVVIISDRPPLNWSPFAGSAHNGSGNLGISGLVSGFQQSWSGIKNFRRQPTITPGYASDSAVRAMASSHLASVVTGVGNVGTGEDNLIVYSTPANVFGPLYAATIYNSAGPEFGLKFRAVFTIANNANAKTLKLYWNNVLIATATLQTSVATPAIAEVWVQRTGLNTQRISGYISQSGGSGALNYRVDFNATGAGTETGAIDLKFTGEATANDDIKQENLVVGWGTP